MPTAVEMILNIAGLEGPGMDHKGSFEVIAFNFGVSTQEAASGGGGTGRAMLEDLVIVKHVDPFTPQLMLACATGRHYKEATFTILPAVQDGESRGGNAAFYKLEDVIVESVRMKGNENGGVFPTEQVTLDAAKMTRFVVGPTGSLG